MSKEKRDDEDYEVSHLSVNSFEGEEKVHADVIKDEQGRRKINYLEEIGALDELERLGIVCDEKNEGAKPILIHDVSIPHHMSRFLEIHRDTIRQQSSKLIKYNHIYQPYLDGRTRL